MVATTARTARFAARTLTILVDRLRTRRASVARCAEALRGEVADALRQRDLSDLFDEEDPSMDSDATTALMLVDRAERLLWEIDEALARVTDGTYGYCIDCGGGIPLKRLRALPATAKCVECSRRPSVRISNHVDPGHQGSNQMQRRSVAGHGPSVPGGER